MPAVDQKILSEDSESTSFTALVGMAPGWQYKGPFQFATPRELFLLNGILRVRVEHGSFEVKYGGYLRLPVAPFTGMMTTGTSCRMLWMSDIRGVESNRASAAEENILFVDTDTLQWEIPWVPGPEPGLKIKLLWQDETSGAYSRLIYAEPGWKETRQEHHDCIEEVYVINGDMTMGGLGTMTGDAYIWRPPLIKHGPMHTRQGALMFIRTDGPLVNTYTEVDDKES
jgi:hypothetical protein